jgi:DNA-directed RNA polymerase specialized sigma24 family protein
MEPLYARSEHGGHRVVPLKNNGFQVDWPHGSVKYPSARQTIIALVNRNPSPPQNARDPHLTFDRYFRRGQYQRRHTQTGLDVFDLFRPSEPIAINAKTATKVRPSPSLTVHIAEPKPEKPVLGFDMEKRAHEVRKLFYAGFARRVIRMGYDPEDVLQDVYTGLIVRNSGKCPFDASKSSFGHYIHMVIGCILSNYKRRYSRLARNEVFGVYAAQDGQMELVDVAEADLSSVDPLQEGETEMDSAIGTLAIVVENSAREEGLDPTLAVNCISYLYEGRRNKEIVEMTGASAPMVSKSIKLVKEVAKEWRGMLLPT